MAWHAAGTSAWGQLERQKRGEAGIAQCSRDRRLHGELGFEPGDRNLVVEPHKAAQARVVTAHHLKATQRRSLQGLRCWLARGLLDLGLDGVDLDAQWAHEVNRAIEDLEHCLGGGQSL